MKRQVGPLSCVAVAVWVPLTPPDSSQAGTVMYAMIFQHRRVILTSRQDSSEKEANHFL